MPLFAPQSLCSGIQLPNVEQLLRQAVRIAQCRVDDKAFYFPAFPGWSYLPFAGLTGVILRNASLPTTGCCGKELPVLKLILRWEGGEKELVIDPPKHADTILTYIKAARPDLQVDDRR